MEYDFKNFTSITVNGVEITTCYLINSKTKEQIVLWEKK